MKSNIYTLIIFFATVFTVASCENETWNSMPSSVTEFFTSYFPGQEVSSYSKSADGSIASVKGGVSVTFNSDNAWTDINGNGSTLPSILLYDQLPQKLYNYLLETESTDGVYRITRNSLSYHVELKDTYVDYDIKTGVIYYPESAGQSAA
ncbi:MAG: hypothetical protein K2H84_07245 [Paramuribaculum sp.]|nr:hypothetical protein [Paramuribaculum sp.]